MKSPVSQDRKIFGIGLEKTGTKSLSEAIRLLGFNVHHGSISHGKSIWSSFGSGDYRGPFNGLDGWVDVSVAVFFAQLDEAFPGSRFILTTRARGSHIDSLKRHMSGRDLRGYGHPLELFGSGVSWGCRDFVESRVRWRIESHQHLVRRHFSGRRGGLLELPLEAPDKWEKLCVFLDRSHPGVTYPHEHDSSGA